VDLFDLDDLPTFLQVSDVDTASATLARDMATGWVQANAGRSWADADSVPAEIRAWAIELAALVYVNPRSLQQQSAGPFSQTERARREQILIELRQWRADQDVGAGRQAPRTIMARPSRRMAGTVRHRSRLDGEWGEW
jgi:hypothetical protein